MKIKTQKRMSNRQLKQEHYKNIIPYLKSKIQFQLQEINLRQKRRSHLKFKLIPKTMKKNQNTNLRVHILHKISSKFFINFNNSKEIVMMVSFIQKRWKQKQDNIIKNLKNKGKKVFIYITKTLVILDIQVLVSLFNQTS